MRHAATLGHHLLLLMLHHGLMVVDCLRLSLSIHNIMRSLRWSSRTSMPSRHLPIELMHHLRLSWLHSRQHLVIYLLPHGLLHLHRSHPSGCLHNSMIVLLLHHLLTVLMQTRLIRVTALRLEHGLAHLVVLLLRESIRILLVTIGSIEMRLLHLLRVSRFFSEHFVLLVMLGHSGVEDLAMHHLG